MQQSLLLLINIFLELKLSVLRRYLRAGSKQPTVGGSSRVNERVSKVSAGRGIDPFAGRAQNRMSRSLYDRMGA
jgi:hypothetical protein